MSYWNSNYMVRAWNSIVDKPSTKSELRRQFATRKSNVVKKTVTNRLGELHRQIRDRSTRRGKDAAFVVLEDSHTGARRYAIMHRDVRNMSEIRHNDKRYYRSNRKRLRQGGYSAEIFVR